MATQSEGAPGRGKGPAELNKGEDSYFECNICLDGVKEPVVTRCGHLFCWPCLYRWLNTNQTECPVCKAGVTATNVIPLYGRGAHNVDPRTKATGRDGVPGRPEAERPQAEPPRPFNPFTGDSGMAGGGWGVFGRGGGGMESGGVGGVTGGQVHFQAGLGFFPSLFGLQFQSFTSTSGAANAGRGQPFTEGTNDGARANDGGTPGRAGGGAAARVRAEDSAEEIQTAEEAQQAFLSRLLFILGSFVVLCLVAF